MIISEVIHQLVCHNVLLHIVKRKNYQIMMHGICSTCKDFKSATKKIDLWNSPDLLIIHLKRFNYTRNYRDRINTLVRFPINGLDFSQYLLSPSTSSNNNDDDNDDTNNNIYDLYAICNHLGGMGGGHYTAYVKNLDNKQWYVLYG